MNRPTKKTVITVEMFRRTTVFSRLKPTIVFCERCGGETLVLSASSAAANLQTTRREIFRLAEAGEIHFLETETGVLFICGNSCRDHLD